ncbi:hypothetical protein ACH5RR_009273 [Cinchona calisaya]|uniref:Uncharacterized protein n=1 Tax=Cinchona calisaya TaxID=153742 RepID=A0ABD3ADQ5_9GENT
MGATIPARIQPGSIDHVPFPTVVPYLGVSLALREKARSRKPGARQSGSKAQVVMQVRELGSSGSHQEDLSQSLTDLRPKGSDSSTVPLVVMKEVMKRKPEVKPHSFLMQLIGSDSPSGKLRRPTGQGIACEALKHKST